ncbi:AIR synthase family protein [Salegentibacter sp. F188]|uniref:AIR synthase family protein n=1 Tax=Autumnicola patrickiae TaxID=3075591 RepID=A0ABU3E4R7_9FLAO|nr:AIR synthase family protein [Salegentibacter sp. F188]MDT0690978.1 AIR synthase family protein [Salegentibacter sp. F188]
MSKELGKIQNETFEEIIFNNCGRSRQEVSIGPAFGVDVSVVDLPNGLALASTSDPLSLIPSLGLQESAWLSVHLMANDMATTGFSPMYGQMVLNLPATFSREDFKTYWQYIHKYCKDIGVAITGGHTGFVEGQNSTISGGGTFSTVAPKKDILVSSNAKPTDVILVTKKCALSSTSILAMSFPEIIKKKLGKEVYEEACGNFYQTSSLKDALAAAGTEIRHTDVTAMHDVTEGGVLGAIYELTKASGSGAQVYDELLPIGHVQKQICDLFFIDPRFSIGAGSMIITCKKGSEHDVMARLQNQKIACTVVGEITEKEEGVKIMKNGVNEELPYPSEDPYWKAFFEAFNAGWK